MAGGFGDPMSLQGNTLFTVLMMENRGEFRIGICCCICVFNNRPLTCPKCVKYKKKWQHSCFRHRPLSEDDRGKMSDEHNREEIEQQAYQTMEDKKSI